MKPDPLWATRQKTNQALYWAQLQIEAWQALRAEPEKMALRLDAVQVERSYAGAVAFYLWSTYHHWLDELALVNRIEILSETRVLGSIQTPCGRLLQLAQVLEQDGRVSPDVLYLQQLSHQPQSWLSRLLRVSGEVVSGAALDTMAVAAEEKKSTRGAPSLSLITQTDTQWDCEAWQVTHRTFQDLVIQARAGLEET